MKQFRPALIAMVVAMIGLSGCQTLSSNLRADRDTSEVPLTKDPRSRALYRSLIVQLNEDGKYYAALAHIAEFERLYGKTPQADMLRGDAFVGLKDLKKAEDAYAAIPDGALSGDKQFGLGRVAAARGNWAQATAHLQNAVAQQPTNVRFLNDLGCTLYHQGRTGPALFALHKAHELAPGDAEVRRNLAIVEAAGKKMPSLAGHPAPHSARASAGEKTADDIVFAAKTGSTGMP